MQITFFILISLCLVAGILPHINHQHWVFRIFDFGKVQLTAIHAGVTVFGFLSIKNYSNPFWAIQIISFIFICYHFYVLRRYTPLYRLKRSPKSAKKASSLLSILSVNVYQFNTKYHLLLDLIKESKPQLVLTLESNKAWENALNEIEKDYPYSKKVAQENTYGMHLYSKLPFEKIQVNYFIADDLPSIEAVVKTPEGLTFTLFGVHPPPPSPTEEPNSKERDGDLLSTAKRAKKTKNPVVVVGDFNNVAWAKSSILFKKTSGLLDPRIGRGFVSTFHAKYKLFRFPIDLFFHSENIQVETFKTLAPINSDHLPLYSTFFITQENHRTEEVFGELENEEKKEVDEMIEDGKHEMSNRPRVATP